MEKPANCSHFCVHYDGLQEIIDEEGHVERFLPQFTCRSAPGYDMPFCGSTFLYDNKSAENRVDPNQRAHTLTEDGWYLISYERIVR